MTAEEPHAPVTVVNVFEIPREDVAAFRAGWSERIGLVLDAPGFRGAQLLEAVSPSARFQLINVTRWDSEEAQRAATADPRLQASVARAQDDDRQRAVPNPGVYRVAADVVPERDPAE